MDWVLWGTLVVSAHVLLGLWAYYLTIFPWYSWVAIGYLLSLGIIHYAR
jgi:hypothetical protein